MQRASVFGKGTIPCAGTPTVEWNGKAVVTDTLRWGSPSENVESYNSYIEFGSHNLNKPTLLFSNILHPQIATDCPEGLLAFTRLSLVSDPGRSAKRTLTASNQCDFNPSPASIPYIASLHYGLTSKSPIPPHQQPW